MHCYYDRTGELGSLCCEYFLPRTHVLVDLEHHGRRVEVQVEVVHQHVELPDLLCHGVRHLRAEMKMNNQLRTISRSLPDVWPHHDL